MKVIFLDIDGVLNRIPTDDEEIHSPGNGALGMDPKKVAILNDITEKTGAHLVLSSAWRLAKDWEETMQANGIKAKFIGATPRIPESTRGQEIESWLMGAETKPEKYVILDDDNDMLDGQPIVRTDQHKGLTKAIAAKVISKLGVLY